MKDLTPWLSNRPRRLLDRLTRRARLARLALRITYGPEKHAPLGRPYARICNRCLRRGRRAARYFPDPLDAKVDAETHRGEPGHFGMRVVYVPEEG